MTIFKKLFCSILLTLAPGMASASNASWFRTCCTYIAECTCCYEDSSETPKKTYQTYNLTPANQPVTNIMGGFAKEESLTPKFTNSLRDTGQITVRREEPNPMSPTDYSMIPPDFTLETHHAPTNNSSSSTNFGIAREPNLGDSDRGNSLNNSHIGHLSRLNNVSSTSAPMANSPSQRSLAALEDSSYSSPSTALNNPNNLVVLFNFVPDTGIDSSPGRPESPVAIHLARASSSSNDLLMEQIINERSSLGSPSLSND